MKRLWVITGLSVILLGSSAGNLWAQEASCHISYSVLNEDRKVMGPVATECDSEGSWPPGGHSVPFGNWGVTSNVGHKVDGHQFDGWCKDHYICDNYGNCKTDCKIDIVQRMEGTRWYQWNSCTTYPQWSPPNCTLYNSNGCTQQVTTRGVNFHGATESEIYVSCPYDSNGDGICDTGGCADVSSFSSNNWMTLYELDGWDDDEVVQSLYFPAVSVSPSCTPSSCSSATSSWVSPSSYDTPTSPALVDAKVATQVNGGWFSDPYGICAIFGESDSGYNCL